jgi:HSP20 family protein
MTALVEPFPDWLRDINRLLTSQRQASQFVPPADVLVDDEGVTVYMDVPGLRAEDLEIELENDILTVRGTRPYPYQGQDGDGGAVRRVERGFGQFERSLRVPRGMDPDSVTAEIHDGVLMLRIPKPEQLKPRRIQVRAGDDRQVEGSTAEGTTAS